MLKEKLKAYEEQKALSDRNDCAKLVHSNPEDRETERYS
jgi:kinesin family protein 18/19